MLLWLRRPRGDPFTPTDWRMTFDGESISLHPSVGNWNQKCSSHYVIQRNRVLEAGPWSGAQLDGEQRRDKKAKAMHYGKDSNTSLEAQQTKTAASAPVTAHENERLESRSAWSRCKAWFIQ